MDIREVAVITDGRYFHKSDVVKIIKEERYKHNFIFVDGSRFGIEDLKKYLMQVDEVWCFGKCDNKVEYHIAEEVNADIWIMG